MYTGDVSNVIIMKKAIAVLCLMLMGAPLAGCIEGPESPITYRSSSACGAIYHVEFFDASSDAFSEWGGVAKFVASDGTKETITDFSSQKKFVFLDETLDWTLEYTFYESDIGFIANGNVYGGNNGQGDTGSVDLELIRQGGQNGGSSTEAIGGVTFSECEPENPHVEFFDLSAFDFCCWDGEVEFTATSQEGVTLSSFSSEKKYVTLEEGHVWTMTYTFYEDDIGFVLDGKEYGGNNEPGDTGSVTLDLS